MQTEALKTYLFPQMTLNNKQPVPWREKAGVGCQDALWRPLMPAAVSEATTTHEDRPPPSSTASLYVYELQSRGPQHLR